MGGCMREFLYCQTWNIYHKYNFQSLSLMNKRGCVGKVIFFYFNDDGMLKSAEKFKENGKYDCKNILCEIFYVVSVCMSGENLRR